MIIVKLDIMKPIRTNNYKLRIVNKCPICNSKLHVEYDLDIAFFLSKRIKNFSWKRFFIKTEKDTGAYNYESESGYQPLYFSMCGNYLDGNKNPQRKKLRISKVFKEKREFTKQTCNHIYCENCIYSEYIENTTYLDVLREK